MNLKSKYLLLIFTILIVKTAFSYKEKEKIILPQPEYLTFNNSSINFESIIKTQSFLKKYINNNIEGQELKFIKIKNSPAGKHLFYKHYLDGTEIFQSSIQANFTKEGKLYSVIISIAKFETLKFDSIKNDNKIWVNTNNGLQLGYFKLENKGNETIKNLYNAEGKILFTQDTRRYYTKYDSSVSAMVYLPNPIVATNANYGGEYKDNGDANNTSLQNARSKVRVKLKYENGKFYLTNGLLTIKNLHDPSFAPVTPTDTFLNYTRNQSAFEDINVFYHLNSMFEYLIKRGFGDMLDSVFVDTHGSNGDDNSFCDPSQFPIEIEYGTGNIDDGEDGQVVIHEFGHMISSIASPSDVIGAQRNAMEEGQADYLCMSYTGSLSNNKKGLVFSWDGHNEFWDGFWSNTSKQYKDLTGIKDDDRDVWSTALMCVNEKLGRNKSDTLILSQFYQQVPNSNMPQMARVILKNDSLIYNGKHVAAIWQCFTDRGILDTVPWYLIKTDKIELKDIVKISNSIGFAIGIAPLKIELLEPRMVKKIEIYSIYGNMIKTTNSEKEVFIFPEDFSNGIYFINLISEKFIIGNNLKIIKY